MSSSESKSQADQTQIEQPSQELRRSPAEWITFGVASAILTTIVGLVLYVWLHQHDQPPSFSITRNEPVREVAGQFYVPFKLENTGGETAESVQVIAELRVNGKVEETGEQLIDFLSNGETEEGAFVFSRNPQTAQLTLRVASYKSP